MRFMIIVKATSRSESETRPVPEEALLGEMARYHAQLTKAGVLLDAAGLKPSSQGWRIRYAGESRTVVQGPFDEPGNLVAGYTLIQVKSHEEAVEWARRYPNPAGHDAAAEIEIRPLYELDDFQPSAALAQVRSLDMRSAS